ncbi:hypothetical protein [Sphingomonas morindae]|uniref:Lytic transglycosylase domain-containing protein n=1 Tax=Sphingomonas morindae TaxID=1541170 RepID=A0ABY4XB19_9SPHN|nr:hypothetical protein [Sphingomonas morindae]USI74162.1 hypothetical protein LHA26_06830 [Sphingomonas morindae]
MDSFLSARPGRRTSALRPPPLARRLGLFAAATLLAVAPAMAASPRDTLLRAAFETHDKAAALALVDQAIDETRGELTARPGDKEARLQQALGTGYRGQLRRSPGDAKAARTALFALAQAYPRDPEVQVAVAGWHLTAVSDLGPFLARTLLGADKSSGYAALDRALALGGGRAFFPAYAALIRARIDPKDTQTPLTLAERAAAAPAPTPLDRIVQRAAVRLLPPLRRGDGAAAASLAKQLLPFGQLG